MPFRKFKKEKADRDEERAKTDRAANLFKAKELIRGAQAQEASSRLSSPTAHSLTGGAKLHSPSHTPE